MGCMIKMEMHEGISMTFWAPGALDTSKDKYILFKYEKGGSNKACESARAESSAHRGGNFWLC